VKKKILKGEVSTIIALGTLIILGISSFTSNLFLKRTQTNKVKATACSQVHSVSYEGDVGPGKIFTCRADTDGTSRYTMACGISKNGAWPMGMKSGACSGKKCVFQVKMDDQIDTSAIYELVAFDFRNNCGPASGKRTGLRVAGNNPQVNQANCDQECCGKPDGFIYQSAIKLSCRDYYNEKRYFIIDGVCQGGKKTTKVGCPTCRACSNNDPDIGSVSSNDLAINECTGGCRSSNNDICSNLPECLPNINPKIIRSCSDISFSCPRTYIACKKERAIWCYLSENDQDSYNSRVSPSPTPNPTEVPEENDIPFQNCQNKGTARICGEYCDNGICLPGRLSGKTKWCCPFTPTPIPPTTNPKEGELGGPCIYSYVGNVTRYVCRGDLECSIDSPDGICIKRFSTPTPTLIPTSTPLPEEEDRPSKNCFSFGTERMCREYCNKECLRGRFSNEIKWCCETINQTSIPTYTLIPTPKPTITLIPTITKILTQTPTKPLLEKENQKKGLLIENISKNYEFRLNIIIKPGSELPFKLSEIVLIPGSNYFYNYSNLISCSKTGGLKDILVQIYYRSSKDNFGSRFYKGYFVSSCDHYLVIGMQ